MKGVIQKISSLCWGGSLLCEKGGESHVGWGTGKRERSSITFRRTVAGSKEGGKKKLFEIWEPRLFVLKKKKFKGGKGIIWGLGVGGGGGLGGGRR